MTMMMSSRALDAELERVIDLRLLNFGSRCSPSVPVCHVFLELNTPCPEKGATLFFAITLPNPNRSLLSHSAVNLH